MKLNLPLDSVTPRHLVASLASDLCPACGGNKSPSQTFCYRDYRRLPKVMQQALYNRLGNGYEQAVREAMRHLDEAAFCIFQHPAPNPQHHG